MILYRTGGGMEIVKLLQAAQQAAGGRGGGARYKSPAGWAKHILSQK